MNRPDNSPVDRPAWTRRLYLIALGACLAAALLAPSLASAATVGMSVGGGTCSPNGGPNGCFTGNPTWTLISFSASAGEANDLHVWSNQADAMTFRDTAPGATIDIASGLDSQGFCDRQRAAQVTCHPWATGLEGGDSVTALISLGDGADDLYVDTSHHQGVKESMAIFGGSGHDVLRSSTWRASIDAGDGADVLKPSSRGTGLLQGGTGYDLLLAKANGAPDQTIDCGGQGRASVDASDAKPTRCTRVADRATVDHLDGPGSGPGAFTNVNDASFGFASEPGARFQCRLVSIKGDEHGWRACPSRRAYRDLANADYRFEARPIDMAGIVGRSASYTWTVDTHPPKVTLHTRRRVRAGGRVRFRGRVLHARALAPPAGKFVEVQVKAGHKWKTVGHTVQTKPTGPPSAPTASGAYRLRYRFGGFYRSAVTYRFRAVIVADRSYPHPARIHSKKHKVRVRPKR